MPVSPNDSLDEVTAPSKTPSAFGRWWHFFRRYPWVVLIALAAIGGASVVTVDITDYYFTSDNFCAYSCHIMDIPNQEMQKSKHWTTASGVRPKCADCHVSGRLTFAMWDHFIGTGELFVWLTNDFTNPEAFEVLRPAGADRVRFRMLSDDSANCRRCHTMEAIKPRRKRGQSQHKAALKEKTTCIACHYNLVHKEVEPSAAFLKAIE